ncbi:hypothetical protein ACQ1PX_11730 [Ornithobacterium rhinotracheale]
MGSVSIDIEKSTSLEEFMQLWETYFFESYFSHLLDNYCPTKRNITNIWKSLIDTEKPFPNKELKENNKTLKDIL